MIASIKAAFVARKSSTQVVSGRIVLHQNVCPTPVTTFAAQYLSRAHMILVAYNQMSV